MKIALILLFLAGPAAAQKAYIPEGNAGAASGMNAAAVYNDKFVSAFRISLSQQPYFASKVLQSFETHVALLCAIKDHKEAAAYLKSVVLKPDAGQPKGVLESVAEFLTGPETATGQARRLTKTLGTRPIPEKQAAALLLANALVAPRTFHQVLSRLDVAKPGFGKQIKNALKNAGGTDNGNQKAAEALRKLGDRIAPLSNGLTYDSNGDWNNFFDGGR